MPPKSRAIQVGNNFVGLPFPSFPRRGGRDDRSGRGGCVSDNNHPGCTSHGTGPLLGGAQPPLLGKEGNAHHSNSFTPSSTKFRFVISRIHRDLAKVLAPLIPEVVAATAS